MTVAAVCMCMVFFGTRVCSCDGAALAFYWRLLSVAAGVVCVLPSVSAGGRAYYIERVVARAYDFEREGATACSRLYGEVREDNFKCWVVLCKI